jgi:hypothetical protein
MLEWPRDHAGWMWEQAFPGTADQVQRVRAAVRPLLDGCPAADDIVHMLSELSANAVTHSRSGEPRGTFIVRLHHCPGNWVRGEVEDEGSSWDGNLPASAGDRSGLFLVLKLASACGVVRSTASNRVVWFCTEYSVTGSNFAVSRWQPGAPGWVAVNPEITKEGPGSHGAGTQSGRHQLQPQRGRTAG